MNPHASAVAVELSAFPNNMSNVIDSLKRLERIGSEESQTVQKILDAAQELSQTIAKYFPKTAAGQPIVAYVDEGGAICLGEGRDEEVVDEGSGGWRWARPRHVFNTYLVTDHGHASRLMMLHNDQRCQVYGDRDTALAFSKDIANGLLDAITKFIENEHKASEEGLKVVSSAAESLKALSDSSKVSDSDLSF